MKKIEQLVIKIVLISDFLTVISLVWKQFETFNLDTMKIDIVDIILILIVLILTFTFVIITIRNNIVAYIDANVNAIFKNIQRHENVNSHILKRLGMVDEMNNLQKIVKDNKGLAGLSDIKDLEIDTK